MAQPAGAIGSGSDALADEVAFGIAHVVIKSIPAQPVPPGRQLRFRDQIAHARWPAASSMTTVTSWGLSNPIQTGKSVVLAAAAAVVGRAEQIKTEASARLRHQ